MAIEVKPEGDTDISSDPSSFAAVRPDTPPEELAPDAEYVEYHGKSTVRRITEEDWKRAKVDDQGETVWNAANGFRVPVNELNAKALQALRNDGSFSVPAAE